MISQNKKITIEIPKIYRIIGKILQFISHNLASRYAIWLFFKPLRFPMPKREQPMNQNSEQFDLFIPFIGKKIRMYRYGEGTKRILLVHGWSGRGTQLFTLADYLVSQNYQVISFDAPAHGKSEGNKTYMKEFVECIREIQTQLGEFDGVIGHSLGAMSVINAVRLGFKTPYLVCIAGGDLVKDIIDDFINKMQMNQAVWNSVHTYLQQKLKESTEEYSASVAVKNIHQPILIIHDTDDIDVPVAAAHNIHKHAPNSELLITEGLGHRRILADKAVIERIGVFISKHQH